MPPPGKHQYPPATLDKMDARGFSGLSGNPRRLSRGAGARMHITMEHQNLPYREKSGFTTKSKPVSSWGFSFRLLRDLVAVADLQRNWIGIDNSIKRLQQS